MNEYRPHQAREALIEMMEEQIRRGKEETREAKEMVGRAKDALRKVAFGDDGDEKLVAVAEEGKDDDDDEEEMVWKVLQREAGFP